MKNKNIYLACAAIVLLCTALFIYTVKIRSTWFGTLSNDKSGHQWLTASTLKFAQYWFNEGPVKLHFGLIENPPSAEFPTLLSRIPYASYPPGTIVPIYVLSNILGHEPTPSIVMGYNLAQHFLITIILSLFVFFVLQRWAVPLKASLIFAFIPAIIYQLLPGILYWHQNVYWADQTIILPFLLIIVLEYYRDIFINKKRIFECLQAVLIFTGILTDWLFFFVVFVLFLKRLFERGEQKRSRLLSYLFLCLPAIFAVGLFIVQINDLHLWEGIVKKFFERTGIEKTADSIPESFFIKFWLTHIPLAYGKPAIILIFASLFLWLGTSIKLAIKKLKNYYVSLSLKEFVLIGGLALLPCFFQVYALKNHSAVHNFSALKFAIPLALIPFVLFPALLFCSINKKYFIKTNLIINLAACAALLLSLTYVIPEHKRFKTLFPEPYSHFKDLGDFISQNTEEKDIIFSTQGSIGANPPQYLYYSKKRIYKVQNLLHILYMIKDLPGPYNICILNNGLPETDPDIIKLISLSFDVRHSPSSYTLYKIRGK